MKFHRHLNAVAVVLLAGAQVACGLAGGAGPSIPGAATPSIPDTAATSLNADTAAITAEPPTRPATGSNLSTAEMLAILQASFGTYPHRILQTILVKPSNQSSTATIETTDPSHVHIISHVTTDQASVVLEGVQISTTLYVKLPNQAWRLANADEQALIGLLFQAADPMPVLNALGFSDASVAASQGQKTYLALGDEDLSGVATTHYHQQTGDPANGTGLINDIWIGLADRRAYKIHSDSTPNLSTLTFEYDATIKVAAPIP